MPQTAPLSKPLLTDDVDVHLRAGAIVVLLLVAGLGGWSATAKLAGAVVSPGTVVVESSVKKVQHPTGGVVGTLRVREGDAVKAGDVLLTLDETLTRANLGVITAQQDELEARLARLDAERDAVPVIAFPEFLAGRGAEPAIARIIASEARLFESRAAARSGQQAQLHERIEQLKEEITGLVGQQDAKGKELELINRELEGQNQLWKKNLVPVTKFYATQREAARLSGERGQLVAQAAQAKGRIAETELQILGLDQAMRSEVMKDLRETEGKLAELAERRVAAEDQLKRVEIRAPQSGIVHQLAVHTIGGVVNQSEPIMLIVPENDALVIEIKIAPQDIDHVTIGQPAFVRFPAFNQRTTPEFTGEVRLISADISKDQQTGQTYYTARVALPGGELQRLGGLKLVPGMPAEVHIKTAERTALSYLLKPLTDQVSRAFNEQ